MQSAVEIFASLSKEDQAKALQEMVETMKTTSEASVHYRESTPPPSEIKRRLRSPSTPYKGGERKVYYYFIIH